MDWDKLRVFHAAAAAGSFTHAGETLGLSQSAVSRQVSALEGEMRVPLFHRHARGLILTEQGELLYRTTQDVLLKLDLVKAALTDSREKPNGELRVTTTIGLGANWLTPRLDEFLTLYPEIQLTLILTDEELDLAMREADVAIRFRQPTQPDLIQRKMFTVHFHAFAAPAYVEKHGRPETLEDLDRHKLIAYGGPVPSFFKQMNWLLHAGRAPNDLRRPVLTINNINGIRNAAEAGVGLAVLPDYLIEPDGGLQAVLQTAAMPAFDTYFVYPEEMKHLARIQVFRDFLVAKAQRWAF
jgi:DNA-binding transcriptional LysR family regulator